MEKNLEYNTEREGMPIPEYGRNIQKMIQFVIGISDREKRNKAAHVMVNIMAMIAPQNREYSDFKHKLWDQLFIISDFKLDVDSPYPMPAPEALAKRPKKIPYPKSNIRYRHYGKNMETIILALIELEDGEKKDYMIERLANFMKMSYLSWNRDSVNDELIVEHLKELSGGKLTLNEAAKLSATNEILARTVVKKPLHNSKNKNQKHRRDNNRRRGK